MVTSISATGACRTRPASVMIDRMISRKGGLRRAVEPCRAGPGTGPRIPALLASHAGAGPSRPAARRDARTPRPPRRPVRGRPPRAPHGPAHGHGGARPPLRRGRPRRARHGAEARGAAGRPHTARLRRRRRGGAGRRAADLRRAFYRTLRHARRAALADRLLPGVRARWGDREAAALLPACTGGTVARLLPELEHAVTAWRALADRHPGPFLARARDRVPEWSFWRRCKAGLQALGRRDPAGLLELLEGNPSPWAVRQLPQALVTSLFRVDVVRAARVVRRTGRRGRLPRAYFENVGGLPPGISASSSRATRTGCGSCSSTYRRAAGPRCTTPRRSATPISTEG